MPPRLRLIYTNPRFSTQRNIVHRRPTFVEVLDVSHRRAIPVPELVLDHYLDSFVAIHIVGDRDVLIPSFYRRIFAHQRPGVGPGIFVDHKIISSKDLAEDQLVLAVAVHIRNLVVLVEEIGALRG